MCNKFTRWMKSYTGTLTGSKTSDKVDKDIKRMLERGELLTLEEFYEKWHEWLTTVYMHTEHSGLKKMGETYKKPYDCFMNEDRYFKAAPPKSYATMLMMKSENVLVRNIGITKWGYEYRSAKKSERGRNRYNRSEVTENQRKKIYKLTQELGWDKPARVNGMCQKMFGVSAVEWLNYQQCSKLIEALKSMLKRQKEKEEQDEGLQANSDSQG